MGRSSKAALSSRAGELQTLTVRVKLTSEEARQLGGLLGYDGRGLPDLCAELLRGWLNARQIVVTQAENARRERAS